MDLGELASGRPSAPPQIGTLERQPGVVDLGLLAAPGCTEPVPTPELVANLSAVVANPAVWLPESGRLSALPEVGTLETQPGVVDLGLLAASGCIEPEPTPELVANLSAVLANPAVWLPESRRLPLLKAASNRLRRPDVRLHDVPETLFGLSKEDSEKMTPLDWVNALSELGAQIEKCTHDDEASAVLSKFQNSLLVKEKGRRLRPDARTLIRHLHNHAAWDATQIAAALNIPAKTVDDVLMPPLGPSKRPVCLLAPWTRPKDVPEKLFKLNKERSEEMTSEDMVNALRQVGVKFPQCADDEKTLRDFRQSLRKENGREITTQAHTVIKHLRGHAGWHVGAIQTALSIKASTISSVHSNLPRRTSYPEQGSAPLAAGPRGAGAAGAEPDNGRGA